MRFVWATRGRSWGFRFLSRGGFADPLPIYSEAFAGSEGLPEVWARRGSRTALRFEDPLRRTDVFGRVIPHDFVIIEGVDFETTSFSEATAALWARVDEEYAAYYDADDSS